MTLFVVKLCLDHGDIGRLTKLGIVILQTRNYYQSDGANEYI